MVYSDHQRLELEKEFHYSRYITIRRKAELANGIGLSERQVSPRTSCFFVFFFPYTTICSDLFRVSCFDRVMVGLWSKLNLDSHKDNNALTP